MSPVTGLRSPHEKVGRIVLFGRMLDKIRLLARGALPAEYHANVGGPQPHQFDARCCRFLGIAYDRLRARVLQGGCDEEILSWAHANGAARGDEECTIWNRYVTKDGWRDDRSELLRGRALEYGLAAQRPETFLELIDLDEGRPAGATRSWEAHPLSVIIVMGVAGSGKTTVGLGLAEALGWEFVESDALHPPSNIAKMSAGNPLDDADRAPWIAAIRADVEGRVARGAKCVLACSALKESHRIALAPEPAHRRFVHLRGDVALIKVRLGARTGHFMKEVLLRSQFETLEAPMDALTLDVVQAPSVIIAKIRGVFGL
jgi:carbohydrate kinase (thermoresistant glucokinase family)